MPDPGGPLIGLNKAFIYKYTPISSGGCILVTFVLGLLSGSSLDNVNTHSLIFIFPAEKCMCLDQQ